MIKCSRRSGHDIPSAGQSPANRRAHSLSIGLPEREPDSVSADPPAAAGQSLPEIWATRLNSLDNQAGATTLLLLGGLGALMSLTGRVPERMGREGIAYEPVEVPAATSAMGELMSDEQPHVIREAAAAVYDQQLASYE